MEGDAIDEDDVGAKSIVFIDVKNGEACSGVVYREKEIITAAHCVVDGENIRVNPRRIKVYYTRNFRPEIDESRNVVKVVVNPNFELGQKDGVYRTAQASSVDIAVLTLAAVHPTSAVKAAILKEGRVEKFLRRHGQLGWSRSYVAAYGFGRVGTKGSFTLRTGQLIVDSNSSKLLLIEGHPRLSGTRIRKGHKSELCPGDSGGGVFYVTKNRNRLVFKDGGPILAGIIMSGSKHECSDEGRMISLSRYLDWILDH